LSEKKSARKASKQDNQKPIFHCAGENDPSRIFELEDKLLTKKVGVKLLSTARRNPKEGLERFVERVFRT